MADRSSTAVVIGAGYSGAGTARELIRRGVPTRILEVRDQVGAQWLGRYDSLRLNTLRWMSHMPGRRMPREWGRYPAREKVAKYLSSYVEKEGVPVEYGVEATRIDRDNGGWRVTTSTGEVAAKAVVVAAGMDREPKIPDWPGLESFTGELIHSSEYRNPTPYKDKDVLVVSAGNTGSEVAFELSQNGAERVRSAVRSIPPIFPRMWGRVPPPLLAIGSNLAPIGFVDRGGRLVQRSIYGNLSKYGLGPPTHGIGTQTWKRHTAVLVDDGYVDAVKNGAIEVVGAVEGFDGPDVILAGGERIQPDAVIAATGYRRGLEGMVGHLDVLEPSGMPTHHGPKSPPSAPGLYFVGYWPFLTGQLNLSRKHAIRVARKIARKR